MPTMAVRARPNRNQTGGYCRQKNQNPAPYLPKPQNRRHRRTRRVQKTKTRRNGIRHFPSHRPPRRRPRKPRNPARIQARNRRREMGGQGNRPHPRQQRTDDCRQATKPDRRTDCPLRRRSQPKRCRSIFKILTKTKGRLKKFRRPFKISAYIAINLREFPVATTSPTTSRA